MKSTKYWLSLILFLLIFGIASGVAGFALVVMFDYVFRLLFPYAVLASSAILIGAGLLILVLDIALFSSSSVNTRWFNRRATLHSLVYSVETRSSQRRRARGVYNNA
jgi:hypothetical protein